MRQTLCLVLKFIQHRRQILEYAGEDRGYICSVVSDFDNIIYKIIYFWQNIYDVYEEIKINIKLNSYGVFHSKSYLLLQLKKLVQYFNNNKSDNNFYCTFLFYTF